MMPPKVEKCRSCGAAIYFVKTEAGGWRVLDAKPERRIVVENEVARVVPTFTDHHATCPQSEEWRNRGLTPNEPGHGVPIPPWRERKDVS